MTTLAIYFEADPSTDLDAIARELQQRCGHLSEVEEARAQVDRSRSLTAMAPDILLNLQVAAALFGGGTITLHALKLFIRELKGVAAECGLRNPRVGAGLARVREEDLTDTHVKRMNRAKKA